MAFTRPDAGDTGVVSHILQIIEAWEGDAADGEPLDLSAINDATSYSLTAKNLNATGLCFSFLTTAGANMLRGAAATLYMGQNMVVAAGKTITGSAIVTATQIKDRTRKIFIPVQGAEDVNTGLYDVYMKNQGFKLDNGYHKRVYGLGMIPVGVAAAATIQVVVISPDASGNIYGLTDYFYGESGEDWNTHNVYFSAAYTATALATTHNNLIFATAVTPVVAGDMIHCQFLRDSTGVTGVLDTLEEDVYVPGWMLTYTADM